LADEYENSEQYSKLTREIEVFKEKHYDAKSKNRKFLVNPFLQFIYSSKRNFLNILRDPRTSIGQLVQSVVISLMIGSLYWQLSDSVSSIQDRVSLFFFVCVIQVFAAFLFMNKFQEERDIFIHERASGSMTVTPYYFSKTLTELPNFIFFPFVLSTIIYWMAGLRRTARAYFIFCSAVSFQALCAASLMVCVGSIAPTPALGLIVAPLFNMLFLLFSGFLININNMPVWYRWLSRVSFFRYSFEILVFNEFSGNVYNCVNNSVTFNYSDCTDVNGSMVYYGDQELVTLAMADAQIWQNFLILIAEILAFRCISFFGIYVFHTETS